MVTPIQADARARKDGSFWITDWKCPGCGRGNENRTAIDPRNCEFIWPCHNCKGEYRIKKAPPVMSDHVFFLGLMLLVALIYGAVWIMCESMSDKVFARFVGAVAPVFIVIMPFVWIYSEIKRQDFRDNEMAEQIKKQQENKNATHN